MIITAGLVSTAIWPTALSRALVMKDEHAVKTQYILAAIPMMGRFMIPMLIGFFNRLFRPAPSLYRIITDRFPSGRTGHIANWFTGLINRRIMRRYDVYF